MKMKSFLNPVNGVVSIVLEITPDDLLKVPFTPLDHALLRDIGNSVSIADQLLGLETIARRLEQTEQIHN